MAAGPTNSSFVQVIGQDVRARRTENAFGRVVESLALGGTAGAQRRLDAPSAIRYGLIDL